MSESSLQDVMSCMGQPVAGNPTQYMMEKCFAAAGLDCRYLTFEVRPEGLGDAVRGMKAMGFRGGNFTIPHKVEVIQYLDGLTNAAELMGAVNCVFRDADGKYIGENTDGKGFIGSLQQTTEVDGKNVVILGAGGAARAIAVELGLAGASEITIVNRTADRGQELTDLLNDRVKTSAIFLPWTGVFEVNQNTDVVINATSIGLGNETARVPIVAESLSPRMVVADVIFNPPKTQFLREASDRGCQILDGLGMLVNQAVICFEIWTAVAPDAAVMREALEEYLEL
ncbi:MAG: shikimate dehydrogenase [Pirellulales bacterium]